MIRRFTVLKDKILLIGAAILDVLVTPAGPEVFEKGSYPADNIKMTFGGDGLNESLVLAALGKKVCLNTILGNDPEGEMIRLHCEKQGILLPESCQKDGMQTGINVVLVEKNGERNFLTNRNGSLRKLSKADVLMPFPKDVGVLCFASIFVSPEFGSADMAEVFCQAREQGICVCADMTKRKNGETVADIAKALQYVDYLMPNEEEAYLVTGADTPEEAAAILQAAGVKTVIIKCGKKGCYVLESEKSRENGIQEEKHLSDSAAGYYVPAVPNVHCVDTTGAGDSFAAGFVYGISEGWDVRKCAEFANQCGAKAVAQVGATSWCGHLK